MLPKTLFVQEGKQANQDLFVNRTHRGVFSQDLGPQHRAGEVVGVYELVRIVSLDVGVVETPIAQPAPQIVATTNSAAAETAAVSEGG